MAHETINREKCISLFHQLMQVEGGFRVLRLLGEAKLGKSHLVAKVFPELARRDYGVRCAVCDLRSEGQTVIDILGNSCGQLGGATALPRYWNAHREWVNRSRVQVKGLQAYLSFVQIRGEGGDESRKLVRHLTSEFVEDMGHLTDAKLLMLFDSVNDANEGTRNWLMDTFLVQLCALEHVRVVVAGRWVPEACGSYTRICRSHELSPVEEEDAYIAFCRKTGVSLGEQSIRDFARAFKYRPGLFVDWVMPTFTRREEAYG